VSDKIFNGLNDKQIEAVKALKGPVLVISGPGSGKTKCLTHRTANLISNSVRPENILCLTFTNKAADEMQERIGHLLGRKYPTNLRWQFINPYVPLIGTFHSVCLKILRREIEILGYGRNFNVLDGDDQTALVKRIMNDIEIDTKRYNPRIILSKISGLKTELISPDNAPKNDFYSQLVARVFSQYQHQLKKMNALDFDDLISFTVQIFKTRPDILEKYQDIWQYVLVDEYQDTSHDQYQLIKLLSQKNKNIFCIGDDAQSIYQFRRADIRNILNFQKDYPEAEIVMLEQNYRSTKNIIAAAQEVISKNKSQISKELWTENDHGHKILIKETLNERGEANFVVQNIVNLANNGKSLNDFAVLYRTHAQSRAIEEALISHGLPYHIVGGIKFYERKEIKDILAFLKFINNPADAISFERIINIPPRGLGNAVLEKVSQKNESNIVEAMAQIIDDGLAPKQTNSLKAFRNLILDLRNRAATEKLTQLIKHVIEKTKYEEYLKSLSETKLAYENLEERSENLRELLTVAKKYDAAGNPSQDEETGLAKFLAEIALLQENPVADEVAQKVTLMTMHASKGLEFPNVFIVGMEEGLFPQNRAIIDPKELEEERRLCYVAITRAKERLILTHTKYRSIYGSTESNLPSRFIGEIPAHVADYKFFDFGNDEETINYL